MRPRGELGPLRVVLRAAHSDALLLEGLKQVGVYIMPLDMKYRHDPSSSTCMIQVSHPRYEVMGLLGLLDDPVFLELLLERRAVEHALIPVEGTVLSGSIFQPQDSTPSYPIYAFVHPLAMPFSQSGIEPMNLGTYGPMKLHMIPMNL